MSRGAVLLKHKLERHSVERIYLRQRSFDASKPRVSVRRAANNHYHVQYLYVGFFRRNKISRVAVHTISEKAIRFRHPDYDADLAQKLTSSSMSRHLSTCNISSKSIHAFLSNLANRQTDRQTDKRRKPHLPPPLSEVKKIVCKQHVNVWQWFLKARKLSRQYAVSL